MNYCRGPAVAAHRFEAKATKQIDGGPAAWYEESRHHGEIWRTGVGNDTFVHATVKLAAVYDKLSLITGRSIGETHMKKIVAAAAVLTLLAAAGAASAFPHHGHRVCHFHHHHRVCMWVR